MLPLESVLIAVILKKEDGKFGKFSGAQGLLGSANKICPDERFICGASRGPDIPLLLPIAKTDAEKKLTGKYTNKVRMNSNVQANGLLPDGFTVQEVSDFLLKKEFWRLNTNVGTSVFNEPYHTPNIYPGQILTDPVPLTPPNDFVTITDSNVVAAALGITVSDLPLFYTYRGGVNMFSLEQSSSLPYIYKINMCLTSPIPSNPNYAFGGNTSVTKVNVLDNMIPFYYGNGAWKGIIYRTAPSQTPNQPTRLEISRGGLDQVKESQVAYILDFDSGVFTLYDPDTKRFSPNPITSAQPPAITAYLYRGRIGNFLGDAPAQISALVGDLSGALQNIGNLQDEVANISSSLANFETQQIWSLGEVLPLGTVTYYKRGPVSIGTSTIADTTVLLNVSGSAYIDTVMAQSLETYSDRRLKENIVVHPVNKDILSLNTYTYNYKTKPGETDIGVIAQEVETVAPHIVKENDGFKTVQYDRFGVLLLPIVKEQQERIDQLESDLCAFKRLLAKISTIICHK
ncbi:MAG: tail fiber domain-containing protein [Actinobacteria bacterium]|nr:tail fiber domain-containing protein [Actinomycetota bacterium]